jgi:UDPglucose--hexose-1-phosphate uridylyltransferase
VSEIRIDPLTGLRTIIASDRARRSNDEPAVAAPLPIDPGEDPLAPGNEDQTPPELYAVRRRAASPMAPAGRYEWCPASVQP